MSDAYQVYCPACWWPVEGVRIQLGQVIRLRCNHCRVEFTIARTANVPNDIEYSEIKSTE
jgi:hypothetical protein